MVIPHRSNPGGHLDPKFVVGRDKLISYIWLTLEQQSIWMTAERRIGKTHVMYKMCSAPPANWTTKFFDLEGVGTAEEFAKVVWSGVEEHLSRWNRTARRSKAIWEKIQAIDLGGVAGLQLADRSRAWKDLLTSAVEDLESEKVEGRLLFFFDELTYMIQRISKCEGESTAMEVLDTLRRLRQTHRGFRMVVSGSVGLHQVLTQLQKLGHQNPVMNDLFTIEIPPIDEADARDLATSLICGENLHAPALEDSARHIAEVGCCWPFLIHHIIKRLALSSGDVTIPRIDSTVQTLLVDPGDPLQMGHFRNRLDWYYPGQADKAAAVLDALALAPEPIAARGLLNILSSAGHEVQLKDLQDITRAMQLDHYLVRDTEGRYSLSLKLFARWWKLDRGI